MKHAPLIDCREITVRYGAKQALAGVTLSAEEFRWTYVIGPTGGGKTTLLRAISGLVRLDAGEIRIGGRLASNHRISIEPHRRGIGFLFQEPSLWPHLDCLANVALGLADRGLSRRDRTDRARQWLEDFAVGGLEHKFPAEISGGEATAVSLARALAGEPRILLLDEPTAHLDLHLREELMAKLRRLHGELGLTTICVTHQIEPPMGPDDRAIILENGAVLHDGATGEFDAAPRTPFTDALRRSLRRSET